MGDPRSTDPYLRWDLNPARGEIHVWAPTPCSSCSRCRSRSRAPRALPRGVLRARVHRRHASTRWASRPTSRRSGHRLAGINAAGHGLVLHRTQRPLINALLEGGCLGGHGRAPVSAHPRERPQRRRGPRLRRRLLDRVHLPPPRHGPAVGAGPHAAHSRHARLRRPRPRPRRLQQRRHAPTPPATSTATAPPTWAAPTRASTRGADRSAGSSDDARRADPNVRAAAPVAGGGGLTDVGIRSTQGGIKEAVILRVMGPLVMSVPARDLPPRNNRTRTACGRGQNSLRFVVPDVNDTGRAGVRVRRRTFRAHDRPTCARRSDPPTVRRPRRRRHGGDNLRTTRSAAAPARAPTGAGASACPQQHRRPPRGAHLRAAPRSPTTAPARCATTRVRAW
jgi:hypothetical protein